MPENHFQPVYGCTFVFMWNMLTTCSVLRHFRLTRLRPFWPPVTLRGGFVMRI